VVQINAVTEKFYNFFLYLYTNLKCSSAKIMTQEESTGPVYWYDKVTARISREYPLTPDEAFEEDQRLVDYAELPAFSSLPRCIQEQFDDLTINRLRNDEQDRNNKRSDL